MAQGEFDKAVSLLLPLRYHLDAIGGSKAQQDVVHLTLLDAALRLPEKVLCYSQSFFFFSCLRFFLFLSLYLSLYIYRFLSLALSPQVLCFDHAQVA